MSLVKKRREAAGLSQADLSRASGVAQPNIAAYERGTRRLSSEMERRLLDAIRPRPSALLTIYRDQIVALAQEHHASNVRVFGSAARGDDGPGSDIDLLVTFDDDASLFDQAELILDLEELTGTG